MSQIFHKSCYTTRSSGYKYRTLSTNTGDKKRRDSKEDCTFDKKFKELQHDIACRIDQQVRQTQQAREMIKEKFEKIDTKISTMLELQDAVTALRQNLRVAENNIADLALKLEKIDAASAASEIGTLHSRMSSYRTPPTLFEGIE